MITVCFLSSAEHFTPLERLQYLNRGARTPFAHQQDTATATVPEAVYTNTIEHTVIRKSDTHISQEHPTSIDIVVPVQKEVIPNNCLLSVVIPQVKPPVLTPGLRRSSKTNPLTSRCLLAETPVYQQRILWQPPANDDLIARGDIAPMSEPTAMPTARYTNDSAG